MKSTYRSGTLNLKSKQKSQCRYRVREKHFKHFYPRDKKGPRRCPHPAAERSLHGSLVSPNFPLSCQQSPTTTPLRGKYWHPLNFPSDIPSCLVTSKTFVVKGDTCQKLPWIKSLHALSREGTTGRQEELSLSVWNGRHKMTDFHTDRNNRVRSKMYALWKEAHDYFFLPLEH